MQNFERFLSFMKFANVEDIPGYARLLRDSGCTVVTTSSTAFPADVVARARQMLCTYEIER